MPEGTPAEPWAPVDGLGDVVEERWRRLHERLGIRDASLVRELVEAARAEPRLRVLSPGMSVCWLRFSRRTTPPICGDLPLVRALGNGRYQVRTCDGRLQEARGVAEAVALVVAELPADVPAPL
ncbi:DUF6193 family natural product biosynthesis protein [Streptomyces sp. NPDC085665]|uniref:DUF6193 family natural product biosynthesis protein n=1 Tax=Streptomyces sp. NPDC085665 TaxID=3365735 RepID=UPI0037D441DF